MNSDIYNQFGATVQYQAGPGGLFLVVSKIGDPTNLINAYGGEVVLRLNQSKSIIARLTLTDALAMQKEQSIAMVGGIHMDINHYKNLLLSLGATDASDIDDKLSVSE
ncbi:MAG: hypothetical protein WCK32_09890 [Chlorobiaceae bacterium]